MDNNEQAAQSKPLELEDDLVVMLSLALQVIARAGGTGAKLVYRGSDDSSVEDTISILSSEGSGCDTEKTLDLEVIDAGGEEWGKLSGLLQAIFERLIECAGFDGYWNGSGGGGTIEILTNGTGTIDHYWWESSNEPEKFAWNLSNQELLTTTFKAQDQPFLASMAAILRSESWTATINYSGSGDSGDVDEVSLVSATGAVDLGDAALNEKLRGEETSLRVALERMGDIAISAASLDGYEINDGGEIVVTLGPDGELKLDYTSYEEDAVDVGIIPFAFGMAAAALLQPVQIDYDAIRPQNTGPWAQVV